MARHGIDEQYYSCPTNQHFKNEKLHAFVILFYKLWHNCYSNCKSKQGWKEKEMFVICCSLQSTLTRLPHDKFRKFQGFPPNLKYKQLLSQMLVWFYKLNHDKGDTQRSCINHQS